jgi:hypothetical protein
MAGRTGSTKKYRVIRLAAPPSVDNRDPSTGLPMQLGHNDGSSEDAEMCLNDCASESDGLDRDALPAPVADEVRHPVPHFQPTDIPLHADVAAWLEEQCQANGVEGCPVHILRFSSNGKVTMLMPVYDAVRQRLGCKALLMDGVAQHELESTHFQQ